MNLGRTDERQELKAGLDDLDSGLLSLAAMLNRGGEGTLFLGVGCDGTVKGLDVDESTLRAVRRRAAELIEPRAVLAVEALADEAGRSYVRVRAEGSDVPYACDGRYCLRTAAANESLSPARLRLLLASRHVDVLMLLSSENQSLTFNGMIDALVKNGVKATADEKFLAYFGMFNSDGRYNLLAYLLADQ
ncbi:MAG: hypothetical protein J5863_02120, partial [Desulfovibrio sp.]|nr:hypothetical protein [Desulfovibrio sp.]